MILRRIVVVAVLLSSSVTLSHAQLPTLFAAAGLAPGDFLGQAVAGAGDVDGDGFADFIVGASGADSNGPGAGRATVYSGRDGQVLHVFVGLNPGAAFGWAVGGAGDVDQDGFADVIVGAPEDAAGGTVRVFSGVDGTVLYTFNGATSGDDLGSSVDGAGDVDGDGIPDLVAGARHADPNGVERAGQIRVFSGADGSLLHVFDGDAPSDHLGEAVRGAGDVNGDGFADIVGGAWVWAGGGLVRVYSGLDGSVLWSLAGGFADNLGLAVSGAGDVNGDGCDDVVIGARRDDTNGNDAGIAFVRSGLDGTALFEFVGDGPGDWLGNSVGAAGDVNGDGFADIVVGIPRDDDGGLNAGSVRIFSGFDGSLILAMNGSEAGANLGWSVAGAGDVNGDGFADVVVGAYTAAETAGAVWVLAACGAVKYGTDFGGTQVLTLDWLPGPSGAESLGEVRVGGAAAGTFGALVVGFHRSLLFAAQTAFLVDFSPASLVAVIPFIFDLAGVAHFAVDLRQPIAAGLILELQAIESNIFAPANVFATPGLEILFCR